MQIAKRAPYTQQIVSSDDDLPCPRTLVSIPRTDKMIDDEEEELSQKLKVIASIPRPMYPDESLSDHSEHHPENANVIAVQRDFEARLMDLNLTELVNHMSYSALLLVYFESTMDSGEVCNALTVLNIRFRNSFMLGGRKNPRITKQFSNIIKDLSCTELTILSLAIVNKDDKAIQEAILESLKPSHKISNVKIKNIEKRNLLTMSLSCLNDWNEIVTCLSQERHIIKVITYNGNNVSRSSIQWIEDTVPTRCLDNDVEYII